MARSDVGKRRERKKSELSKVKVKKKLKRGTIDVKGLVNVHSTIELPTTESEDECISDESSELGNLDSLSNSCRLCAKRRSCLISMYSEEGEKWNIVEKISRCVGLVVLSHDVLPTSICQSCLTKLNMTYDIVQSVVEADVQLKSNVILLKNSPRQFVQREGEEEQADAGDIEGGNDTKRKDSVGISQEVRNREIDEDFPRLYCRLCAKKQTYLLAVYSEHGEILELVEKISRCFSIVILPRDELPTSICHPCHTRLNMCYDVIHSAVQAVSLLKSKLAVLAKDDIQPQATNSPSIARSNSLHLESIHNSTGECNDTSTRCEELHSNDLDMHSKAIETCETDKSLESSSDNNTVSSKDTFSCLEGPVTCDPCNIEFSDVPAFDSHTAQFHFKTGKWECQFCYLTFNIFRNLVIHKANVHSKELVKCEECAREINYSPKDNKNGSLDNSLRCMLCGIQYSNPTQVERHYFSHKPRRIECGLCGTLCSSLFKYRLHKRIHKRQKTTFKCDGCEDEFESRPSLSRHRLFLCSVSPFTCKICGEIFARESTLQMHERRHSQENGFQCSSCEKQCSSLSVLRMHERTHEEPLFICEVCSKPFWSGYQFQKHRNVHDDSRLRCEICLKTFKRTTSLNRHRAVHNPLAKDRFKCSICERPFRYKMELKQHEITHSNFKPHLCEICGQTFNRKSNMVNHRALHFKFENCSCIYCGEMFVSKLDLKCHLKVKHPGMHGAHVSFMTGKKTYKYRFPCNYCGKILSCKASLMDHERIHTGALPYRCDICNRKFRCASMLNQHTRIHTGEKRYLCNLCGKKFVRKSFLDIHMRLHTGLKPFSCDICAARFTQKGDMMRHRRRHTGEMAYHCDVCNDGFMLKNHLERHKETHAIMGECASNIDGEESSVEFKEVTYIVQNVLL